MLHFFFNFPSKVISIKIKWITFFINTAASNHQPSTFTVISCKIKWRLLHFLSNGRFCSLSVCLVSRVFLCPCLSGCLSLSLSTPHPQVARKLAMVEADLERAEERAETGESWVSAVHVPDVVVGSLACFFPPSLLFFLLWTFPLFPLLLFILSSGEGKGERGCSVDTSVFCVFVHAAAATATVFFSCLADLPRNIYVGNNLKSKCLSWRIYISLHSRKSLFGIHLEGRKEET